MARLYGRAVGKSRVRDHMPKNYGKSWTTVAMMSLKGVEAPMVLEGAMDTLAFETYIRTQVCPALQLGDIVVMDNLSAHKSTTVRNLIEAQGAHLEYLPPYSPDFNPIELCWSKSKTSMRSVRPTTPKHMLTAVGTALRSTTPADCRAWFLHDGYAVI